MIFSAKTIFCFAVLLHSTNAAPVFLETGIEPDFKGTNAYSLKSAIITNELNAPMHRILDDLLSSTDESRGAVAASSVIERHSVKIKKDSDEIGVKITYSGIDENATDPATILGNAISENGGCSELKCERYFCSAWCDISRIKEIENLPEVGQFTFPKIPETSQSVGPGSGSISTQAIVAMQVDELQRRYPELDGRGFKIGIISDSYELAQNPTTTAEEDIASGDLPSDVVVLKDSPIQAFFVDEGRAMAQLVYDLAPGSKISFYSGFLAGPGFAEAINALVEDGCDVIVDDLRSDTDEPVFQLGPTAIAANDAAEKHGIPYFTVARNLGDFGYESEYKPTACPVMLDSAIYESCHDFGEGNTQFIFSFGREIGLHWDNPWFSLTGIAPKTDLDIFVYDSTGNLKAVGNDLNTENGDAVEGIRPAPSSGGLDQLIIAKKRGTEDPKLIKWLGFARIISPARDPNTSSLTGPGNAPSVAAVGAAFEMQVHGQIVKEAFTSRGGTPIIFDTDGNRLEEPLILKQPRFTGPDGSFTTFFGLQYLANEPTRFFGTSCAAPNVAAVALLMLQAISEEKKRRKLERKSPKKSKKRGDFKVPEDIYTILEETATDMDESGFDFFTGYGFVNALGAVEKIKGKRSKNACPIPDFLNPVEAFF